MPKISRRLYPHCPDELKHWATPHHYIAKVTKVADGDSVHVAIQLGFGVTMPEIRTRLLGIDAPELIGVNKHAGHHSRRKLTELISDRWLGVETYHDQTGRYGRWLVVLWIPDHGKLINVNQWMVNNNFAKPLKINRYFDAKPHHLAPFIECCPKCKCFTSLIDGHQTMDPRNSAFNKPTKAG